MLVRHVASFCLLDNWMAGVFTSSNFSFSTVLSRYGTECVDLQNGDGFAAV
jgi:hypothetical protein